MEVLNLQTGKIEEREDPWEGQREELEASKAFWVDGIRYAGHCDVCRRQVLWEDKSVSINKICGNTRVSITHRRCL